MKLRRISAAALAGLFATTALVACGSDSDGTSTAVDENAAEVVIRIGTTDHERTAWSVFEDAAAEEGITLDIVPFGDYNSPNPALAQDQLDVNLFQHIKFLAEHNVGAGDNLVPVGSTEIIPLALYWQDHDSTDGIEGEDVAIPNDPSNQGRAINVLVQAGLVTLSTPGMLTPTPADIDQDASEVSVLPMDAAATVTAYNEGRPAVINNSFLERATIDPDSAVFKDDPNTEEAEPYINVFVTREDNADDANIARLVEIWHTPAVQDALAEDTQGTSVEVERTPEELQEILDRLVEQQAAEDAEN